MYSRHLLLYNVLLFINVIQPLDDYGDDIIMHGIIQMLFVSSNSNLVHFFSFSLLHFSLGDWLIWHTLGKNFSHNLVNQAIVKCRQLRVREEKIYRLASRAIIQLNLIWSFLVVQASKAKSIALRYTIKRSCLALC